MDVLDSLKRRSKALKHQNATPVIERLVEIRDGKPEELVEVTFKTRSRQTLALTVWCDRWVSIRAFESVPRGGWKFQYTQSGRFLGAEGGRKLIEVAEASLSEMYELTDANIGRLDVIWRPLLAKGPKAASSTSI
jgi:hypothetical protein